jgi:hypothetical protein
LPCEAAECQHLAVVLNPSGKRRGSVTCLRYGDLIAQGGVGQGQSLLGGYNTCDHLRSATFYCGLLES